MNIDSFPTEFTNDLESFVKTPIQFTPLTAWDERRIAAPERHYQNGIQEKYTPTTISFLLENHNPAFDMIENLLQLFVQTNRTNLNAIDAEKEQCWLFGWKWLQTYYDLLTNPSIVKSAFYKYENTRFLALLRSLLHPDPTTRISFRKALEVWYPKSPLLIKPEAVSFALFDDDDSLSKTDPSPVEESAPAAAVSLPLQPPLPSVQKPRLVLKRSGFGEERNKTRRNCRS